MASAALLSTPVVSGLGTIGRTSVLRSGSLVRQDHTSTLGTPFIRRFEIPGNSTLGLVAGVSSRSLIDIQATTIDRFSGTISEKCRRSDTSSIREHKKVAVPVIDLGNFEGSPEAQSRVLEEVKAAASQLGYFFAVNHGIDSKCLAQKRAIQKTFFESETAEKLKVKAIRVNSWSPVRNVGYGIQNTPQDITLPVVSHRETFITKSTWHETSPQITWPTNPPEFRDVYRTYERNVLQLGVRLLNLLAKGLGLPPTYMDKVLQEPRVQLTTSWYHPLESLPKENAASHKAIGVSPHTDITMLVVLLQNEANGVECWTGGQWVRCDFPEEEHPGDALLILVGECMEVLSNGIYHSPLHRVMVHPTKFRLSNIASIESHPEAVMGPAPHLIDDDHPALYKTEPWMDRLRFVLGANPERDYARLSKSSLKVDPSNVDPSREFVVSPQGKLLVGDQILLN